MKRVFGDTFFYLALLNPEDKSHGASLSFAADYSGGIVTTAWVLTEVADALAAPRLRHAFASFLNRLDMDRNTLIVRPSERLFREGVELYSRHADKGWSLTDCISFRVMRQKGITEALTGDRHFIQAGFKALFRHG